MCPFPPKYYTIFGLLFSPVFSGIPLSSVLWRLLILLPSQFHPSVLLSGFWEALVDTTFCPPLHKFPLLGADTPALSGPLFFFLDLQWACSSGQSHMEPNFSLLSLYWAHPPCISPLGTIKKVTPPYTLDYIPLLLFCIIVQPHFPRLSPPPGIVKFVDFQMNSYFFPPFR